MISHHSLNKLHKEMPWIARKKLLASNVSFFFFFFELLIFKYALDCIGSMEEDLMFSPIMRH